MLEPGVRVRVAFAGRTTDGVVESVDYQPSFNAPVTLVAVDVDGVTLVAAPSEITPR